MFNNNFFKSAVSLIVFPYTAGLNPIFPQNSKLTLLGSYKLKIVNDLLPAKHFISQAL